MGIIGRLFFTAALAVLLAATAQAAPPLYHVTDLGVIPGGSTENQGYGINSHGDVVGVSGPHLTGRAFRWTSGAGMEDLGDLPGPTDHTIAWDINDAGQVTGYSGTQVSTTSTISRSFIWSSGSGMQDIGSLPGTGHTRAFGINASGQVVGFSETGTQPHAFLWTSGVGMQDLGAFPGGNGRSEAQDVNDHGEVVGQSNAALGNHNHAFLWTSSAGMQDLGDLPGGQDNSFAVAINNSGQVVGQANSAVGSRPFVWTSATGMQDLGGPGNIGAALDINASGQIIGYNGAYQFLWTSADGMLDVQSLLDSSGLGWQLYFVYAINDAGQIAGYGMSPDSQFHSFLLTPVPEPGTAALAACGAALLAMVARGRGARRRRGTPA